MSTADVEDPATRAKSKRLINLAVMRATHAGWRHAEHRDGHSYLDDNYAASHAEVPAGILLIAVPIPASLPPEVAAMAVILFFTNQAGRQGTVSD